MAEGECCEPDFEGVGEILKMKRNRNWLSFSIFECCPWEKFSRPGAGNLLKWKFITDDHTNIPYTDEKIDRVLPIKKLDKEKVSNPPTEEVQVTWIGHATMLVQFDGITILTDPVFGEYCGPSNIPQILNYKRYRKASCQVDDLDHLDAVIISHNHYDHLEENAVRDINEKFKEVKWFVASGQKKWMKDKGLSESKVVELDWWHVNKSMINGREFKFICTPTQHWCQRRPTDFNKALWCGWVIQGPTKKFYFPGDTGYYSELFKTIGKKYGPFDLAGIPIGAYEPRYITKFQHVNPEESVQIHEDIQSKLSIGIHWGTFALTNEFFVEPPQKVKELMDMMPDLNKSRPFFCLNHGETWSTGDRAGGPDKEREFMKYKPKEAEGNEGTAYCHVI